MNVKMSAIFLLYMDIFLTTFNKNLFCRKLRCLRVSTPQLLTQNIICREIQSVCVQNVCKSHRFITSADKICISRGSIFHRELGEFIAARVWRRVNINCATLLSGHQHTTLQISNNIYRYLQIYTGEVKGRGCTHNR